MPRINKHIDKDNFVFVEILGGILFWWPYVYNRNNGTEVV